MFHFIGYMLVSILILYFCNNFLANVTLCAEESEAQKIIHGKENSVESEKRQMELEGKVTSKDCLCGA